MLVGFMSTIRPVAREAFRKLLDEEQQTMAVQAFYEGLKDHSVAAIVATQARRRECKPRSKSAKKTLLGVPPIHDERHSNSREFEIAPRVGIP